MDYIEKKLGRGDFPEDTTKIVEYCKSRGIDISHTEVNILYPYWCEDYWCAGWLIVDEDTLKEFADWLEED